MTLTLTLPRGESVYTGRQVTFRSPCASEGLTALVINDVTYDLVNAMGTQLVANSFDEGAMVSVIFNAETFKAFVQNADTNAYLEAQLGGKAPADTRVYGNLQSAGWYKVGSVRLPDVDGGSLRILTYGNYYNNQPYSAVIDVVFGFNWANIKTIVPATGGNGGITRVAVVNEGYVTFGVYVYYNSNSRNGAGIDVKKMNAAFTPINFEAASNFNEASAIIADVGSCSFAPAGYGLGEKCITVSSWDDATKNGFYHCENWSGYVTAHAAGDISQECFGQMSGKMYKRFRWYCDGSWKEWEWVNPPMLQEQEYRTTERLWGKPIYKKLFYYGVLPNATQSNASHGIQNLEQVKKITLLPRGYGIDSEHLASVTNIHVDAEKIYITTNTNFSTEHCFVLIEYTRL